MAPEVFWLNKADFQPVAKVSSPSEMAYALKHAPVEVVRHHIRKDRNDFSNWALDSLKQPDLAKRLSSVKSDDPNALEKLIEAFLGKSQIPASGVPKVEEKKQELAQISGPGFPSKNPSELDSSKIHPQAEALKKQTELSATARTSQAAVTPFNLKSGKKK